MAQSRQAERTHIPRLTIFNHKGGVGKTTMTVNIASALATLGKRVMLVDSDPQCNVTSYLIEDSVVDDLLDKSDTEQGATVWSALKPISEGTGDVREVKPVELTNNLYIVPGDIRLAEFEQELNSLWGECFQRKMKGFRGTTALSYLVNELSTAYKIDFVFYDSGPNIGALNRAILLDCDYFAIPAACDLFSIRAMKTLGYTLGDWVRSWRTILNLAPDDIYLLPGKPQLLGYIPQRFRVYGGRPSSEFAKFLPQLERHVFSDVVAVLKEIDPALIPIDTSRLKLGEVKDFSSLVTASQVQGVWLAEISAGTPEQRAEARDLFVSIATRIIELTSVEPRK